MARRKDQGHSSTLPAATPIGTTLTDVPDADAPETLPPSAVAFPTIAASTYTFVGELARGGMGRVLRAVDRRLDRDVAIKEILPEQSSTAALRFEREAMLTAKLQHPNIVTIYEAGRWGSGHPFYAMRLVPGRALSEVIRESEDLGQRLALLPNVLAAALALAYAHGEGIIHRDLKPHNILVGSFGETVVIDWGLAKRIDAREDDAPTDRDASPDVTLAGSIVGTPAYMPPEQAAGKPVDERADVYALGAILYHLLAGQAPYRGESAVGVLRQIAAGAPTPLGDVVDGLPPDLIAIVSRAMERDSSKRYATARELAAELQRYTTGQLVAAHRYSAWELARRWLRRHLVAVTVGVVAALALAVVGVASYSKVRGERDRADAERADAVSARNQTRTMLGWSLAEQGRTEALDGHAVRAIAYLAAALDILPDERSIRELIALSRPDALRVRSVLATPAPPQAIALSPDGSLVVAIYEAEGIVWDVKSSQRRGVLHGHESGLDVVSFADGNTVIALSRDGVLRRWHPDGTLIDERALWGHPLAPIEGIAFSRFADDATYVVTLRRRNQERLAWESSVDVWDVATGARRATLSHGSELRSFGVGHGGLIATSGSDGNVRIWSAVDGTLRYTVRHSSAEALDVAFSPDGKRLASTGPDGVIRIWDTATGMPLSQLDGKAGWVTSLIWSHDGHRMVSANIERSVFIWDLDRQSVVARTTGTPLMTTDDGLALVVDGRVARLVSLAGGTTTAVLEGHDGKIAYAVQVSDQHEIITASEDASLRVWDATSQVGTLESPDDGDVTVMPDATRLLVTSATGSVQVHRAGTDTTSSFRLPCRPLSLVVSPDGSMLAAQDCGGVTIRRIADGAEVTRFPVDGEIRALAFQDDSRGLLIELRHRAELHDLTGKLLLKVDETGALLDAAAVSPSGSLLAVGHADGTLEVFDVRGARRRFELRPHRAYFAALRFTRDGRTLLAAYGDGHLDQRDATDGALVHALRGHTSHINSLCETRDGKRLVSAGWDGTARVWDLETGAMTAILDVGGELADVQLSPDESLAVATSMAVLPPPLTVVWDVATGRALARVPETSGLLWNDKLVSAANGELHVRDLTPYRGTAASLLEEIKDRVPWVVVEGRLRPRQ